MFWLQTTSQLSPALEKILSDDVDLASIQSNRQNKLLEFSFLQVSGLSFCDIGGSDKCFSNSLSKVGGSIVRLSGPNNLTKAVNFCFFGVTGGKELLSSYISINALRDYLVS